MAARTDSHTRRWSSTLLLAIGADAHDRGAVGGQRAAERDAERSDVGRALPAAAVQRRRVREIEAVRRRDVLDERVALARGRQEVEDPAAVVVEQHDRQLQAQPGRGEQPADVVRERDVADQEHHRAARSPRRRRTRSRPCRRSRSRRGWRGRATRSRARGRTSRRRAPASRRRRPASRRRAASRRVRRRRAARSARRAVTRSPPTPCGRRRARCRAIRGSGAAWAPAHRGWCADRR